MAPKRGGLRTKVVSASPGMRKSQRHIANILKRSSCHHDNAQSAATSENTENTTPALNDDCLLAIFCCLPIRRLLRSVSICCHKFNALALDAVKQKCRTQKFVYNCKSEADARIIRRFGEFMRDVEVYDTVPTEVHSFTWLKYCVSLKRLTIRDMMIDYNGECANILQKLENLSLISCGGFNFEFDKRRNFILACENLKSIDVRTNLWHVSSELIACVATLETIEKISLDSTFHGPTTARIAARMAKLKQLKYMKFPILSSEDFALVSALSLSKSLEKIDLHVYLSPANTTIDLTAALDKFPTLKSCEMNFEWRALSVRGDRPHPENGYDASHLESSARNFDAVGSGKRHKVYFFRNYRIIFTRRN